MMALEYLVAGLEVAGFSLLCVKPPSVNVKDLNQIC
jgi:hypothetical protein